MEKNLFYFVVELGIDFTGCCISASGRVDLFLSTIECVLVFSYFHPSEINVCNILKLVGLLVSVLLTSPLCAFVFVIFLVVSSCFVV